MACTRQPLAFTVYVTGYVPGGRPSVKPNPVFAVLTTPCPLKVPPAGVAVSVSIVASGDVQKVLLTSEVNMIVGRAFTVTSSVSVLRQVLGVGVV